MWMDMSTSNRSFILSLAGKNTKQLSKKYVSVPIPWYDHDVICFFDIVHLVKKLRNAWYNSRENNATLMKNELNIVWDVLLELHERDKNKTLPMN